MLDGMERVSARRKERLPIDATLRSVALLFRVLGWGWMAVLVALTPSNDPEADMLVVWGTLAAATIWTVVTWWVAIPTNAMDRSWFVGVDILITAWVGIAPTVAGAEHLFHGGWLNSTLFVIAYAYTVRPTVAVGIAIGLEQVLVHWLDDRGVVPAAGSIGFIAIAILVGWAYDHFRLQERRRIEMQSKLDDAIAGQARHQERLDIANRLHDSVLQTLSALRMTAEEPAQVRYLVRRQERELRHTISEYRSPYDHSALAELLTICDDVEDMHRIEIDTVIRGDAEFDDRVSAMLGATREALLNAAKHSGTSQVDLYAEFKPDRVEIFVRDRGRGFDPTAGGSGHGMEHSLRRRAEDVGATVAVTTSPNAGTQVEIGWQAHDG